MLPGVRGRHSVTAWGSISFTSVTYADTLTFLGSVASGSDTQGGGGTFAYGITGQASGASTVIANCAISPTVRTLATQFVHRSYSVRSCHHYTIGCPGY